MFLKRVSPSWLIQYLITLKLENCKWFIFNILIWEILHVKAIIFKYMNCFGGSHLEYSFKNQLKIICNQIIRKYFYLFFSSRTRILIRLSNMLNVKVQNFSWRRCSLKTPVFIILPQVVFPMFITPVGKYYFFCQWYGHLCIFSMSVRVLPR